MSDRIRIIIADDHPIVRAGFVKILAEDDRLEVVAEAADGRQAVDLVRDLKPEIAVLDLAMPLLGGLEALRMIDGDSTRVIILTMFKDQALFQEALDCGVWGYVLKDSAVQDLTGCIHAVAQGRHYISPMLSEYLIQRDKPKTHSELEGLTPSELRILRLISENLTSKEIADALCISYRTVQNHRTNICRKLGISGYNALLAFSYEHKDELTRVEL